MVPRHIAHCQRIKKLLRVAHQVDLRAQLGEAAVHVARDRRAHEVLRHLAVPLHQVLHVFRGNGVAERVFERHHVEPRHVAPHQRQQAEHLALAAHVEHQFLAHLRADAQLHRALLHNVERLRHLLPGGKNNRVLGEVLQRHRSRQRANLRRRKKLERRNLLEKIDD
jgi:predicted Zn-dependent protease with MMP-like domain